MNNVSCCLLLLADCHADFHARRLSHHFTMLANSLVRVLLLELLELMLESSCVVHMAIAMAIDIGGGRAIAPVPKWKRLPVNVGWAGEVDCWRWRNLVT